MYQSVVVECSMSVLDSWCAAKTVFWARKWCDVVSQEETPLTAYSAGKASPRTAPASKEVPIHTSQLRHSPQFIAARITFLAPNPQHLKVHLRTQFPPL